MEQAKTGKSKSCTAAKATTSDSRGRGVKPEILRDLRGLRIRSNSPPNIVVNDQLDSRNSDDEGMVPTAPATPEAPCRQIGNALVRHELTSIEDVMDVTPVLPIQSEPVPPPYRPCTSQQC
ncbi:hypothetical protein D9613_012936 [Agrocybe pediades]|uniref:Uncharacterized protein n=1 Tax=Agrocybe pediades TaxID=84607 RepID=A0A8H4VIU0_9AGAR|nr:hypothetical protein D9613_012936 [Agrocybe pediades]